MTAFLYQRSLITPALPKDPQRQRLARRCVSDLLAESAAPGSASIPLPLAGPLRRGAGVGGAGAGSIDGAQAPPSVQRSAFRPRRSAPRPPPRSRFRASRPSPQGGGE